MRYILLSKTCRFVSEEYIKVRKHDVLQLNFNNHYTNIMNVLVRNDEMRIQNLKNTNTHLQREACDSHLLIREVRRLSEIIRGFLLSLKVKETNVFKLPHSFQIEESETCITFMENRPLKKNTTNKNICEMIISIDICVRSHIAHSRHTPGSCPFW